MLPPSPASLAHPVFHSAPVIRGNRRGCDTTTVQDDQWAEAPASSLQLPGTLTWAKLWSSHSTPLPAAWRCNNVLGTGPKPYVSKSPAGAQQGIAACAALQFAWENRQLDRAGLYWQTSALRPQTLVHHHNAYYLIIACACYAARVWPAEEHAGGQFVLDPSIPWEWISVAAIEEWAYVPMAWCVNAIDVCRVGFLGMRRTGVDMPAVVAAMANWGAPGVKGLSKWLRAEFCRLFKCSGRSARERELALAERVLASHPEREAVMASLIARHAKAEAKAAKRAQEAAGTRERDHESSSDTDSGEEPDEQVAALTGVAVTEMAPLDVRDCRKDGVKYKHHAQAIHRDMAAARRAAQLPSQPPQPVTETGAGNLEPVESSAEQVTHTGAEPLPASAEAVPVTGAEPLSSSAKPPTDTGGGQAARAPVADWVRSNVAEVAPLLPWYGQARPGSMKQLLFNRIAAKRCWTGRFVDMRQDFATQHKTHSVTWAEVGGKSKSSEHQAFQKCLEWLWSRAKAWYPEIAEPSAVRQALENCKSCKEQTACTWRYCAAQIAIPAPQDPPESKGAARKDASSAPSSSSSSTSSESDTASEEGKRSLPGSRAAGLPSATAAAVRESRSVRLSHVSFLQIPGDGNCLFAAFGVSQALQLGRSLGPLDAVGLKLRQRYLSIIRKLRATGGTIDDVSVTDCVRAATGLGIEQYLELMSTAVGGDRRTWGGTFELATLLQCVPKLTWCATFEEDRETQSIVLLSVLGRPVDTLPACVVWRSAGHYDVAQIDKELSEHVLDMCRRAAR